MKPPRVMQVIMTQEYRGDGTEQNPIYLVQQYWDMQGKLLAEFAPAKQSVICDSPGNLRIEPAAE